jgi:O-antigen/teichoic acid export membrane protein
MVRRLFSSQLRTNMTSGIVTTIVNIAMMVVAYPIYLYFLGYEKYGVWLVLATVLTFAQLGNLGMGQAVMKLVAEDYGRGDINGVGRYATTALALLSVSGVVALIAILALKYSIVAAFKLDDENAKIVLWLLPYIGVLSIYVFVVQVFEATLSGLGRMDLTNYIQSFGRSISVIVTSLLLLAGLGVKSLLIGSVFSYLFIHVVNMVCIWRIAPIHFLHTGSMDIQRGKQLLRFGGAVFGSSLISMLLSPFNKLILSRYAGVSAVTVYEIAFTGSMQVRGLVETGLRALLPEISRISADITIEAKNRILQLNSRAMKLIFFFGVPVYTALIGLAPWLLGVWLGERSVATLPWTLRIMLLGTFLSLLCVPAYYTLMGMGKVRYCLASQVIQGGFNAAVVGAIIILTGTISLYTIAFIVAVSMGLTSVYVLYQKYRAIRVVAC